MECLEEFKRVDIDDEGTFKYILIRIAKGGKNLGYIVRGKTDRDVHEFMQLLFL